MTEYCIRSNAAIVRTFALRERRSRRLSRHRTARYRPKSRCPETAGGVRRHRRCAGQPLRSPAHTRRGRHGRPLRRVTADVISTGRVESAAVYCEAELDASAMALGGLGHHAPVSVERRGNCGRSGTDGCGSGRQSDGADTIADHVDAVRHQNTMAARKAIAAKVAKNGMPFAISLRSVRVFLPLLFLIEATELIRSVCIADLGRGGS